MALFLIVIVAASTGNSRSGLQFASRAGRQEMPVTVKLRPHRQLVEDRSLVRAARDTEHECRASESRRERLARCARPAPETRLPDTFNA